MSKWIHRHDISDKVWSILSPLLPGQQGGWGAVAKDNRLFINAVFWILRTGSPWRDLPSSYGDWKNTHRRFSRWRDNGIWERILDRLINNPDFKWLMIDSTYIKVHMHGTGAKGGNQSMSRTKGGFNTKLHLAVDASGMPVRAIITEGTRADCSQSTYLIEGITPKHLLADRAYDTDKIIKYAREKGIVPVIPPKKNRKIKRDFDKNLYKFRHLVENMFLKIKQWRGISTRYAKNTASFLAAVQIRCIHLWTNFL
ncbi:IS5 family transposase [Candidatus Cardinium hertigii]|uniref:IS5 family transposase n=1 Tax=Candidatus Cardinium hertigii TaxID=247481 RepID=UPI003D7CF95B